MMNRSSPARRGAMLGVLVLAAWAASAGAHDKEPNFCGQTKPHPIDITFDAAMNASGGVTFDMKEAIGTALAAWDGELNRLYRALMRQLPKGKASALRDAQRAWLAWDKQQGFADMTLVQTGGSMDSVTVMELKRVRVRNRVCELRGVEDALATGD